ncbi:hypothetical protein ACJ5NV_02510 [Loktanella agnita]|uniref:hypothetical protein n=1 Tax=Loktanella agnita TaxID=287097 RepID=UPI0039860155
MLDDWLILTSAACLLLTSTLHAVGGEIYLLRPMFRHRGNRVLDNQLGRLVLRFAWHVTSLSWVMLAVILYGMVYAPGVLNQVILLSVGMGFLVIGLFDLVVSKGRHVGWPLLTLTGVFALAALIYN